jgi:ATP:corrinoid adenosyltransferase
VLCPPRPDLHSSSEEEEQAREGLQAARAALARGKFNLVMLDEINVAVALKLLNAGDVLSVAREKPQLVK